MKATLHKKQIWLAAAAVLLVLCATVGTAFAYFTTYATAQGTHPLRLKKVETEVTEEVKDLTKHITIKNTGEADCFVRVKVFASYPLAYTTTEDWSLKDDGYWYYAPVLPVGENTDIKGNPDVPSFEVKITELPIDTDMDEVNVIVVQECTPVCYTADGEPYANWDSALQENEGYQPATGEGA